MATNIGKRILDKRKELGLTQEELAFRMGYKTKSAINKIELGINDVTQTKVVKFAEVLNTTPAYLMGWEEEQKKNDTLADIVVRMRNDQFLFEAITKLAQLDNETLASAVKLLDNPELIQTAAHITELDEVKKAGIKAMVSTFLKQFQDEIQK